jgi:hypothetical protein
MHSSATEEKPMAVVQHVDNKFEPSLVDPEKPIVVGVDRFGAHAKTDPLEIALVRKLDMFMLVSCFFISITFYQRNKAKCSVQPILWLMYFLNFLDRNAMVNGKLNGLDKDLKLKGTQYNTLVSILFVGYLVGQVPSNMILNRVRPAWFMGGLSHGALRSVHANCNSRIYDGVGSCLYIDLPC